MSAKFFIPLGGPQAHGHSGLNGPHDGLRRRLFLALLTNPIHNGSFFMPPSEQPRVFISYARKDGAALAQRLQKDLNDQGFDPWLDTQRIQGGATWTDDIEIALDRADYVAALLTQGSYVSEICRAEQLRAL